MDFNITTILISLAAGIVPTLLWLWFWLQEDSLHPEPKRIIIKSFVAGMCAVPLALLFQALVSHGLGASTSIVATAARSLGLGIFLVILWAIIEEVLKFALCYWFALRDKEDNEPIDPLIYLITAALGFAAAENALFLLRPLLDGDVASVIITGNLRFIGATLLHIACSGIVGLFYAFSFYKHGKVKHHIVQIGLILAIALHALFNLFIILDTGNTFFSFALVWSVIILIIFLFEKVKRIAIK